MRLPSIRGVIDRRILANWRVDPAVLARILPEPFRPQVVGGFGIAGVCLIRLAQIRPAGMPAFIGVSSENAAHRIAVQWEQNGTLHHGVYIPRRDTDSRLTTLVGGRLFSGAHHHARFTVDETSGEAPQVHAELRGAPNERALPDRLSVSLDSDDGQTHVRIVGNVAADVPATSIFGSLAVASSFFESGSLGYSATSTPGHFDGIELCCENWAVKALAVSQAESSFFDESCFPPGSVTFDCALLMRGIQHQWRGRGALCGGEVVSGHAAEAVSEA